MSAFTKTKYMSKSSEEPTCCPKAFNNASATWKKPPLHYDKQFLNFAFAYGGRAEIVDAIRVIAEKVKAGRNGT